MKTRRMLGKEAVAVVVVDKGREEGREMNSQFALSRVREADIEVLIPGVSSVIYRSDKGQKKSHTPSLIPSLHSSQTLNPQLSLSFSLLPFLLSSPLLSSPLLPDLQQLTDLPLA